MFKIENYNKTREHCLIAQMLNALIDLYDFFAYFSTVADSRGGGDGGDRPPPREVEKITSTTTVVNFCADFVGVPIISALFSNQAPSTINEDCRLQNAFSAVSVALAAGQIFFSL